ncbi:MAG TPA: hypothetical protein VMU89_19530 [Thermomicrobiaceae bacterium]|nr:hypothetical protein [Thermomicrobiaceae bacterium]
MTLTLGGRIQTRLVLMSSVGLLWTLAMARFFPRPAGVSLRLAYQITLGTAITMTVFGIAWEVVYHGLQQLRWDKDWPSVLGLLAGPVEAVPVWLALHALGIVPGDWGLSTPFLMLFAMHFSSTSMVVWLAGQGPLRVIQPRWRFEGGTFSRRPPSLTVPFLVTYIGMLFVLGALWLAGR